MITSDGYGIEYFPQANRIVIYLPQTLTTISNTVSMISNRRDKEMAAILSVVKAIMEVEQCQKS